MVDDPKQIWRLFVKFISKDYVDSLVEEGLLYMNNVEYFRKIENKDSALRGDKYEGNAFTYDSSKIELTYAGIPLKTIGKIDITCMHELETNLYCLTAINDDDIITAQYNLKLSEKFKQFGDKAVLIPGSEIGEFCNRVKKATEKDKNIRPHPAYEYFASPVDYVDRDTYHGPVGIFRKFKEFSWQYEWRIAIKQNFQKGAYEDFKIGSIKDICIVTDTEDLIKNLKCGKKNNN